MERKPSKQSTSFGLDNFRDEVFIFNESGSIENFFINLSFVSDLVILLRSF